MNLPHDKARSSLAVRDDPVQSLAHLLKKLESLPVPRQMKHRVAKLSNRPNPLLKATKSLRRVMSGLITLPKRNRRLDKTMQVVPDDFHHPFGRLEPGIINGARYKAISLAAPITDSNSSNVFNPYYLTNELPGIFTRSDLIDIATPFSRSLRHLAATHSPRISRVDGEGNVPGSRSLSSLVANLTRGVTALLSKSTQPAIYPGYRSSSIYRAGASILASLRTFNPHLSSPAASSIRYRSAFDSAPNAKQRTAGASLRSNQPFFSSSANTRHKLGAFAAATALDDAWPRPRFGMNIFASVRAVALSPWRASRPFRDSSGTTAHIYRGYSYPYDSYPYDVAGHAANNAAKLTIENLLGRIVRDMRNPSQDALRAYPGTNTDAVNMTRGAPQVLRPPVGVSRERLPNSPVVTLNYSPRVTVAALHQGSDIERTVLAAIERHGYELVRILNRELARQGRTDF